MSALTEDWSVGAENARLRELLAEHRIPVEPSKQQNSHPALDRNLTPVSASEKVKLFRALFRGRDDVYAVRW